MVKLIKVATFDMIPMIDELNEFIYDFENSVEENTMNSMGWNSLGFETRNFIFNTGSISWMIIAFILF
jgi:hypothetical protein